MKLNAIEGRPVVDAKSAYSLVITKADIKGAARKQPAKCAVVRAVCRQMHVYEARVHLGRVYLRGGAKSRNWVRYLTPGALRQEIIAFDRGGTFEPGRFTLGAPTPSSKLGKRTGGATKKPYVKSGKKRRPHHVIQNVRAGAAATA